MRVPALDEVSPLFEEFSPDGPGCCLGIYIDGELVLEKGFGLANLEHRVPITSDTVFDLASTSKQFTAASVLLLAEDGALDLDDDVRKHFPEFALEEEITVRQLIHHTSGLRDVYSLFGMVGWTWPELMVDDQIVEILSRQRSLNFAPGTSHSYSNSGYVLLSALVRRVSGKTLREFCREAIFEPLEMSATDYRDDITSVIPDRANGYRKSADGSFNLDESPSAVTGDGALNTTIRDLARWEANFLRPVIGTESFRRTQLETAKLPDGTDTGYAAGLFLSPHKGLPSVSHGGAWAGFRSDYIRFPQHGLAVAVFANVAGANPSALVRKVADLCLAEEIAAAERAGSPQAAAGSMGGSEEAEAPDVPQGEELTEVDAAVAAGLYGDGVTFLTLTPEGNDALLVEAGGMELVAQRNGPGGFATTYPALSLAFTGGRDGPAGAVVRHGDQVIWTLPRVDAAQVSDAEADALSGTYRCEEVDASWSVRATADGVEIDRSPRAALTVQYGPADVLLGPGFNIRIERAEDGSPVALLASDSRAKGLRFGRAQAR